MTLQEAIAELVTAAQIIMAPPNIVSNEQRHTAEAVFLAFRKSKSPYNICREILERCDNQYVMFEAAEVLKEAVVREWSSLGQEDKSSLKQYLMQYITTKQVPHFIRDKILQVIAIMVKRASIDDEGKERGVILAEVKNLIMYGEPEKQILGCSLIENLMQEYACTVKSADVGLAWEIHFKTKKQFEATDLKVIFTFCTHMFYEIVKNDTPCNDPATGQLLRHILLIAERVLTWGFVSHILPRRLIGIYESMYEADQAPALKLRQTWSEIVFQPDLLPVMFQIYWKVRDIDELAHHAMACLVQLASLTGEVTSNQEQRLNYLQQFLSRFFNLVSNLNIGNKEALGISNIVKKLVIFFILDFPSLPSTVQETLLNELTRLTCYFCDGATHEDLELETERFYTDAFNNMLDAWTHILPEFGSNLDQNQKNCAVRIFNKYVQCHIAGPDGTRAPEDNNKSCDEDIEDNDRKKYKEELQIIGMFGRSIPDHSLPVLFKILESRIEALTTVIGIMQQRAMSLEEAAALNNLFEDLHWALLITGHVLSLESVGETPMIPSEIMKYSIDLAASGRSQLEASVKIISEADARSSIPAELEQSDHVVRVLYDVMRLCSLEEVAVGLKLGHFLSPEVDSTILWFLKRWCMCYLLPVENYYQEMSPVLLGCFGRDTACSKLVVSFVMSKVQFNLFNFHTEPVLLQDTVELFCDVLCAKQRSAIIIKTDNMVKLIQLCGNIQPGVLPPQILRGLYKGLIMAGACLSEPAEVSQYYETILTPLDNKFRSLISQENFAKMYENEAVQKLMIDLMESFIGVAKGSQMSTADKMFAFLAPFLYELPKCLQLYKDYQVIVQLILELFGHCAKYMLCYLAPLNTQRFYETCLATVECYAKCNKNRLSSETFAEESSCQDLVLVLDLLTFILSKDCIDLCANTNQEEITVTASDVSLYGLKFVLPLMNLELLKFPNLCKHYYCLLVMISDIYPEKICNLSQDMISALLNTIELGLTNFGNDIVQACLDFVLGMASYLFRRKKVDSQFGLELKRFLKLLMDLTLSHQINSDMLSSASTTIFALICCYQEEYQTLVHRLIQGTEDPATAKRLAAGFDRLTADVNLNCDRRSKLKFRDNFEKFLANVHGFLLHK